MAPLLVWRLRQWTLQTKLCVFVCVVLVGVLLCAHCGACMDRSGFWLERALARTRKHPYRVDRASLRSTASSCQHVARRISSESVAICCSEAGEVGASLHLGRSGCATMAEAMTPADGEMFAALFGGDFGGEGAGVGQNRRSLVGTTAIMAEPVGIALETATMGGDGEHDGNDMESEEDQDEGDNDSECGVSVSASSRQLQAAGPSPARHRGASQSSAVQQPGSQLEQCGGSLLGAGVVDEAPSCDPSSGPASNAKRGNTLRRRTLASSAAAPASSSVALGAAVSADPGHVDWSSMELHRMSLDMPFPSGQLYKALQRARNTMHGHILELPKPG